MKRARQLITFGMLALALTPARASETQSRAAKAAETQKMVVDIPARAWMTSKTLAEFVEKMKPQLNPQDLAFLQVGVQELGTQPLARLERRGDNEIVLFDHGAVVRITVVDAEKQLFTVNNRMLDFAGVTDPSRRFEMIVGTFPKKTASMLFGWLIPDAAAQGSSVWRGVWGLAKTAAAGAAGAGVFGLVQSGVASMASLCDDIRGKILECEKVEVQMEDKTEWFAKRRAFDKKLEAWKKKKKGHEPTFSLKDEDGYVDLQKDAMDGIGQFRVTDTSYSTWAGIQCRGRDPVEDAKRCVEHIKKMSHDFNMNLGPYNGDGATGKGIAPKAAR